MGAGSLAAASLAGCALGRVTPDLGPVVSGVYPREVERTFFDYEYVEVRNPADDAGDVVDTNSSDARTTGATDRTGNEV